MGEKKKNNQNGEKKQRLMGVCYNSKGHDRPKRSISLSPGCICDQCGKRVSHMIVTLP